MKTDPRIDQKRTSNVNQLHDGNVLNVLRLAKYWNSKNSTPMMSSYLLENIVLNYYESRQYNKASRYIDIEIGLFLSYLAVEVRSDIQDPKLIQGNINNLDWQQRVTISSRALEDVAKANDARRAEDNEDFRTALSIWRKVFGPDFPIYG